MLSNRHDEGIRHKKVAEDEMVLANLIALNAEDAEQEPGRGLIGKAA